MKIITKAHHKKQIEVKLHELFAVEIEGSQSQGHFVTDLFLNATQNFSVVKEYKYTEPAFSNVQKIGKRLYLMMATELGENEILWISNVSASEEFSFFLNVVLTTGVPAGRISDNEPIPGGSTSACS